MSDPTIASNLFEAKLEEYKSLREETLKCVEFRYQIFNLTLIAAGTLLTVGIADDKTREVLLVYPIISFFFANAFVYNSMLLVEIGAYIRDEIEDNKVPGLGWANHFKDQYGGIQIFELVSTYGLFIGTQIVALVLYRNYNPQPAASLQMLLNGVYVIIFLTVLVLLYPVIYHKGVRSRSRR
jgi:hypothetical protein